VTSVRNPSGSVFAPWRRDWRSAVRAEVLAESDWILRWTASGSAYTPGPIRAYGVLVFQLRLCGISLYDTPTVKRGRR
jgi:hypothetical protein